MSGPKWDGKLYRPVKFGEGMQPGTLEWEHERRRQAEHWREVRPRIDPPPSADGVFMRAVKQAIKALFRVR